MQTQKLGEDSAKSKTGLLALAAAAAVAVIVGGLLLLRLPFGPSPVAGPTDPPAEVAEAFLEAYARYDADTAAAFLSPEALAAFGGDLASMRLNARWREASGFRLMLNQCDETNTTDSGVWVRCTYDFHGVRSDEIGWLPHFEGSRFDFTIRESVIVSVSDQIFMDSGYSSLVWEPFAEWIAERYPEDLAVMYTDASLSNERLTEESIALWQQRGREYVEVAQERYEAVEVATRFMEAYESKDIDGAASIPDFCRTDQIQG